MNIFIIGSGNVATQLGKNLQKANHHIVGVYSRTQKNAKSLAKTLKTIAYSDINYLPKADVYLIAVKDSALSDISDKINSNNTLVLHTAGSVDMDVLKRNTHYGVLYPLQTIQKAKNISFKQVPLLIEANTDETLTKLKSLAWSLSTKVLEVNSKQRLSIHLSAVFACNFTNYFYAIAEDILQREGLSFSLLEQLVKETFTKAFEKSPTENQTGPAARNDQQTIQKHLKLLENYPDYQKLYNLVTEEIINHKK